MVFVDSFNLFIDFPCSATVFIRTLQRILIQTKQNYIMRKLFSLLLVVPFLLFSCESDDDVVVENTGSVEGTWGISAVSAGVETGNVLANAALNIGLQSYASSSEPQGYVFDANNNFTYYFISNGEVTSYGTGVYELTTDSLFLTYDDSQATESFKIITANSTTLSISKNYLSDLAVWGSSILENFTGISISSATATMTYVISE